MSWTTMVGAVLIVLGALALIYGGFTYTSERHDAKIGSLELALEEKDRVNVPRWAGIAALVVGAGMVGYSLRGRFSR